MKTISKYLIIFFTAIFSIICILKVVGNNSNEILINSQNNFSINIYSDKTEFIEGENVWITVKIKNESVNKDSLPLLTEETIPKMFKIKNLKNNAILGYHGIISDYLFNIPYNYFLPFEEKTFEFEIQNLYGDKLVDSSIDISSYFLENNYEIFLQYKYEANSETSILSNKIYLNVVKPYGREIEAFNDLIKIYQIQMNKIPPYKKDKIDAYINFMKKYPKSVYMERVIEYSSIERQFSKYKFDDSYISDGLAFIDNFPNSRLTYAVIYVSAGLMKSNKNDEEIKDYLINLGRKYPGTRAQTYTEKLINEYNQIYEFK